MEKIKKNISYNIVYQLLNMLLPLITTPYIARVMGVSAVGTFSYTYAIVQYFMLFVTMGLVNYGNRTIAKSRDNTGLLRKNFWNIYYVQFMCFLIVSLIYFIYILFLADSKYIFILIIQYIYILSAATDINWLYYGLEKFKAIVIRNSIIKVFFTILIFIFVKNSKDIYLYTLFCSSGFLIANVSLWKWVFSNLKIIKPNFKEIKKHFKKNLILFIPVIAISLYNIMDKIMVGSMINVENVALYDNAEKIINVPLNILTSVGTAMLPRISNLVVNNKNNLVKKYIENTMNVLMFMVFPMIFGLILVSDKLIILYLGDDFKNSIILVKLLSIIILFKTWANIIRTQYLIPKEKDTAYIISIICGALVNLILNLIMISKIGVVGAVYATIIAEVMVCLIQTISVRKELPIKKYLNICIKYFLKGIFMYLILMIEINTLKLNRLSNIFYLIVIVFSGLIIYSIFNIKSILLNINILRQNYRKNKMNET